MTINHPELKPGQILVTELCEFVEAIKMFRIQVYFQERAEEMFPTKGNLYRKEVLAPGIYGQRVIGNMSNEHGTLKHRVEYIPMVEKPAAKA